MLNIIRQTVLCLASSALAFVYAPVAPAHACSPARCAPSVFLPISGHVPSNAIEFLWRLPWTSAGTNASYAVRLYKLEDGQRSEIESETIAGPEGFKRVRPLQPLAEGTVLVLDSAAVECPNEAATPAMVTVSAAAPKPSRLGSLSIGETHASTVLNIPTARGSCRADFEVASAQLKLALAPEAQPFADSLRHALVVDGSERAQHSEPAPISNGYPLGGALEDVIYTLCKGDSDSWTADLKAGTHRVQWLSKSPDGSELRSDEVSIDLRCGADAKPAIDAGVDANTEAAEDSAATPSTEDDVETGGVTDEIPASVQHGESCALHAPTSSNPTPAWLFGLGVALLALRRR